MGLEVAFHPTALERCRGLLLMPCLELLGDARQSNTGQHPWPSARSEAQHWLVAALDVVARITCYPSAVYEQKPFTKRFGEACRRYMDRVPQMNAILGIIRHLGCPTPGEDEREDGMCETILVPLDGSKRAEAILPHVERLARLCEAEVILLQVIDPPARIEVPEEFNIALHNRQLERLGQRAKEYLSGLEDGFREQGIRARKHVLHGPIVEAILSTASREKADLVAIASHGRTGLAQVFYGSVAAGVLHRIDRPLLLVRSQEGE